MKAQIVSLNAEELKISKELSVTNNSVNIILERFKTVADKALNDKPNPVKQISSEGLLEGNPLKIASLHALKDVQKIYALAVTYRLTGQSKYLQKASDFLMAWAKFNKASGNPINETKLEDLIVGYDFIRDDIDIENRNLIDAWLKTIADAELHSKYANPIKTTSKNNWNSHRIKIVTLIAYTIHNQSYDGFIKSELESQISKNLNPDGTSIDFEERDALHYHIYDLEPLLQTVIAVNRANGKNYYSYQSASGASIEKAVKFLVPFVSGEKTHIEFANSKAAFDKARAANNEKGYQLVNFKSSTGIYVLALASYFDEGFVKTINATTKDGSELNWQLLLNRLRELVY